MIHDSCLITARELSRLSALNDVTGDYAYSRNKTVKSPSCYSKRATEAVKATLFQKIIIGQLKYWAGKKRRSPVFQFSFQIIIQ